MFFEDLFLHRNQRLRPIRRPYPDAAIGAMVAGKTQVQQKVLNAEGLQIDRRSMRAWGVL